jgi:6-phosphogluconolactonase (cycloisomerase 2 family)
MAPIKAMLLAAATLFPEALGAKLLVSHFSGSVYTLDLTLSNATSGTLAITSKASGCGEVPTWLTLDQATNRVWCFDESWSGSGVITQYSVDANGVLTVTGSAPTPGNSVWGAMYGGADGKGFVATAE